MFSLTLLRVSCLICESRYCARETIEISIFFYELGYW